jgi:signal transduction histidine kinase
MSIKFKFTIFISCIILLMVIGMTSFLYITEKKLFIEQIKNHQQSVVTSISQSVRETIVTGDELILINYVNLAKKTDPGIDSVAVLDTRGVFKAHTDSRLIGRKASAANWPEDKNIIRMESPVYLGNEKVASCVVNFYRDKLKDNLDKELDKTKDKMYSMVLISLVFGFIGAWVFSYIITEPIKVLSEGAEIIGNGTLTHKIRIKRNDELGQLARHFNSMSEKLKELDEMKKDFVSSVTHELRSPLSAIETYVNLLLDKNPEYERENFLRILKNIARLRHFINDLLDSAKIEKGKMEIVKIPFDLVSAVNDIIELFRIQASEKKIALDFSTKLNILKINGDEDRVKQVVTNLVSNALKFTPSGGKIAVGCQLTADEKSAEVSVSDTGIGIPSEDAERIFLKFEQVKGIREQIKGPKGTGLGLAIAKGIVELHGGAIRVESELHKGTTFYFTLPL